jgi:putative phage-type endonuclease
VITFDCEQGTPEWLAARAGVATASCFSDVLGDPKKAGRRNYRARLVVERLTGKKVEGYNGGAMKKGSEREPLAKAAYEARSGAWVRNVGFIRHDTLLAGASPDGLLDENGGLECKCPELSAHMEYLRLPDGRAPSDYIAQIQGQMWIAELSWVDFVSFNPDFPEKLQLVVRHIKRDNDYIASLAASVRVFLDEVAAEAEALERLAP